MMEISIPHMQFLEGLLTSEYGIDLTYGEHMSHPLPGKQNVYSAWLSRDWQDHKLQISLGTIDHRHDLEHNCWVDSMEKEEYLLIHKQSGGKTILFFTSKYNEVIKYMELVISSPHFDFDLEYPIQLFDFINIEQLAFIDLYPVKFIRDLVNIAAKFQKSRIEHQAKILEKRLWDMIISELDFA